MSSVDKKEVSLGVSWKMAKDSVAQAELGRSFHQLGTDKV